MQEKDNGVQVADTECHLQAGFHARLLGPTGAKVFLLCSFDFNEKKTESKQINKYRNKINVTMNNSCSLLNLADWRSIWVN